MVKLICCVKKERKAEQPQAKAPELPVDKGWAWVIVIGGYCIITLPILHILHFCISMRLGSCDVCQRGGALMAMLHG